MCLKCICFGLDNLLDLLGSTNDSVLESACGAIWNLCQIDENKNRVGIKGIEKLLGLIQHSQALVRSQTFKKKIKIKNYFTEICHCE